MSKKGKKVIIKISVLFFIAALGLFGFCVFLQNEVTEVFNRADNIEEHVPIFYQILHKYRDFFFLVSTIILYVVDSSGLAEDRWFATIIRPLTLIFIAIPALWIINDTFVFINALSYLGALLLAVLLSLACGIRLSQVRERG